jgi:flagellar basal-body rod modification protein FlgD
MIDAVSSILPQSTQEAASAAAQKSVNENFDLFLSLLTTQLQNQDPLDPMDTSEMTSQLVQFTSVEQTIATNTNLEQLISLTKSQTSGNAVDYIGKEVEALSTAAKISNGGSGNWRYSLASNASEVTLTVVDSNGTAVYTETVSEEAGTHDFTWDGTETDGSTAPDGTYFLTASALDSKGEKVNTDVRTKGIVDSVDFTADPPILMIGNIPVSLENVTSVTTPATNSS